MARLVRKLHSCWHNRSRLEPRNGWESYAEHCLTHDKVGM